MTALRALPRDHFHGIEPHLKFHYMILLRECASPEPGVSPSELFRRKKLSDTQNQNFVDYMLRVTGIENLKIKKTGNSFIHMWTSDETWEMILKLSDEFPHHLGGILEKHARKAD